MGKAVPVRLTVPAGAYSDPVTLVVLDPVHTIDGAAVAPPSSVQSFKNVFMLLVSRFLLVG
jgi:hypothetical protein